MEHLYGLMDADSLGSTRRVSSTAMEYSHGQMEVFIMANIKKIKETVTHTTSGPMAMSIMDSTRKDISGEKEYSKKKAYYTTIDMCKAILSAKQNTDRYFTCEIIRWKLFSIILSHSTF